MLYYETSLIQTHTKVAFLSSDFLHVKKATDLIQNCKYDTISEMERQGAFRSSLGTNISI